MLKKLDAIKLLEAAQPTMQYLLRMPGQPSSYIEVLESPFNPEFPNDINEFNRWNNELGIQRRSVLRIMAAIDEVSLMIRNALAQPGELGIGLLGVGGLRFGLHLPETKEIFWKDFNASIERRMIFDTLDERICNNWIAFNKSQRESKNIVTSAAAEVSYTIQQNKNIPGIKIMSEIPNRAFMATGHRVFVDDK